VQNWNSEILSFEASRFPSLLNAMMVYMGFAKLSFLLCYR
jgi:hypothetical protein